LEGWTYNQENVQRFEERARIRVGFQRRGSRTTRRSNASPGLERQDKKRSRNQYLDYDETLPDAWVDQVGIVEADDNIAEEMLVSGSNDTMLGVNNDQPYGTSNIPPSGSSNPMADRVFDSTLRSSLVTRSEIHGPVVNWQKLYSERHRMESNWTLGAPDGFMNFRLPVANHEYEAHTQCVYTIQYTADHLVSGSRDKTVRVWSLATGRLLLPPLQGHGGSVLCLQFDEKPGQDVIISGGSDSAVIVWRFSTGEKIKVMTEAHTQPVLMLRFNNRYLVTCSKDSSIKVWNRKELVPTDDGYPKTNVSRNAEFPEYIVNLQAEQLSWQQPFLQPLSPYSLLMTLTDHKAAVNAISLVDHQVVSASGDRKIKLWDIRTGSLIRTYSGHTKGIACVQYDGRRIISGSSDETIRIFDAVTSAPVATLEGHRQLVRTVQAEFGDLNDPDAEETLRAAALKHELSTENTAFPSDRDTHQFVTGARIPPGGGGTRWSKIVSGSYDETVKIWRQHKSGRWQITRELRQDDALIRAGTERGVSWTPYRFTTDRTARQVQLGFPGRPSQNPQNPHAQCPQPNTSMVPAAATTASTPAMGASFFNSSHSRIHHRASPGAAAVVAPQVPQTVQQQPHLMAPPTLPAGNGTTSALERVAPRVELPIESHNARVFKLQFDARRIICCSQQSIIVGWDFANNDEMLINASQFFGAPSMTGC